MSERQGGGGILENPAKRLQDLPPPVFQYSGPGVLTKVVAISSII